jgi:hypothetical protein
MTQDQIRKLLGGYATNALTADERRILFEAALEDQDLFNALQNEDALRELLADPVSREQVRKALETPNSGRSNRDARRGEFSWRRWIYGVAMPAVAAVIVITVMNRANAPGPVAPQTMRALPPPVSPPSVSPKTAPHESAPKMEAVAPKAKKQTNAPRRIATNASSPVIQAPIQLESARPAVPPVAKSFLVTAQSQMPDAVRQQFAVGFAADAPLYQGPLVRYSIVRGGPDADALRVEVSTRIAGYLALYQVDAAGKSKRIYPSGDPAMLVFPDRTIQIPSSPIRIDAGERLRLVVVPAAPSAGIGQLGGAVNGAVLGTGNAPNPAQPAPLVVDIPLAPN